MVVFGDDNTVFNPVSQTVGSGLGHLPGGFAGGYQQDTAGKIHAAERPLHRRVRLNGGNGFPDNLIRVIT